jgi:hypothetical protein
MNAPQSSDSFVEDWLRNVRDKFPNFPTVSALSDATQLGQLNEATLLRRLRDLSQPPKKETPDDQG